VTGTAIAHQLVSMRRLGLLGFALLVGCKPESLRLSDELDRSSSWLSAVAEVGRTTAQNSTPLRYARNTIEDAAAELNKAASSLEKVRIAPDITRDGRRLIIASTTRIDELRADLDAGAVDMHGNLAWLRAASDTLSDLADRARKAGK
jgi:hypothetical protein